MGGSVAQLAQAVFLLIDADKVGRRALAQVLDIAQIDTIITDALDGSARSSFPHDRTPNIVLA